MLSLQLKQLEKSGLIGKRVFAQVPPKVEYYLTSEGKTLLPALEELAAWGRYKADKEGAFEEVKRKKLIKKKRLDLK
jgi:DNA-binding HxlR family transcriptional regulator